MVRDAVADYLKENYTTGFGIRKKNSKSQSKRKNIEMSLPLLDSIPVGAKTPVAKTLSMHSSSRKEKVQNEYIPEDSNSDSNLSDSLLRDSDSS